MIYFELMFGNLCLESRFSSGSPGVPTPSLEIVLTTFLHCIVFVPLSKIVDCIYVCLLLGSLFFSVELLVDSFTITTLS